MSQFDCWYAGPNLLAHEAEMFLSMVNSLCFSLSSLKLHNIDIDTDTDTGIEMNPIPASCQDQSMPPASRRCL